MSKTHDAGIVTAYGAAVRGGYTGTYEEFCAQQAQYAENARQMERAVSDVRDIKTSVESAVSVAETHANNAGTSATNASNSAASASNSADSASQSATSAQASATNASNSAASASQFADNASNSANSASQSATSAQTSATNASTSEQSARQAAETAQDILDSVQSEGNTQISRVQAESNTQIGRVQAESNTQIGRVQAKGNEIIASLPNDFTQVQKDITALNGSLGTLDSLKTAEQSDIVGAINELASCIYTKTQLAANYFRRRAAKYGNLEFGASWPSWDESHLSAGTRTKNAVDMVAYPSTDETAARNDFDNYFYGLVVNGHVETNGDFTVDYFESDTGFSRTENDTYMLFPPMYFKYDFTGGGEEIDLCLSQKEGYAPVGPAIKSDGTVRDFIPIACYGASLDDNDIPMSVSGACIVNEISHNNQITTWKKKGTQYTMETVQEYEFLNILFMVTFATRNTQRIMAGCTSYDKQISPAVAETGVKRVIVTNADAAFFIVGSTVSVGTAKDRGSTANNIVDRRRITQIEDLGNGNSAIYIDALETFDVATSNFLSTMPWWSGATDTVLGTCGSPGSNSNGKYPYRLFGVECAWGQYVCLSNVIYKITSGVAKMYVTYDATKAASNGPNSDYEEVDYVIAGIGGKDGYISERGYDPDNPFVRFPTANGRKATSSTGYADNTYGMNSYTESTNGTKEVLVGGYLTLAANAGRFYVFANYALSPTSWYVAARLSALGACSAIATGGQSDLTESFKSSFEAYINTKIAEAISALS